jgi:hypothetical protein
MQAEQVPPEFKPVFDYLLQKLEERATLANDAVVIPEEVENEPESGGNGADDGVVIESDSSYLELTESQQSETDAFLENMNTMKLSDLTRIYGAMLGVSSSVPSEDLIVIEFMLEKIAERITQLEQQ